MILNIPSRCRETQVISRPTILILSKILVVVLCAIGNKADGENTQVTQSSTYPLSVVDDSECLKAYSPGDRNFELALH